jgi:uncharacterized repeat protein (TIGR03806 family)
MRRLLAAALALCAAAPLRAEVDDAALMAKRPAKLLSDYGLFADGPEQRPAPGVIPYTVANPLWSDGAEKLRFVRLPAGAAPAPYAEDGPLDLPVGSVLVKTFAFPSGDGLRLIETRLLIRQADGWTAWPYLWNDAGTDAELKLAGAHVKLDATMPDGTVRRVRYAVPNRNQCKGCHAGGDQAIGPIGPKIRNLNLIEPGGGRQLDRLAAAGVLAEAPADAPAVPAPFDPAAGTVDERARSYLDANCGHCHRPGGPADTSGLYLTWEEDRPVHRGVNKPPVAAGRGSGGREVSIAPGDPDASILLFRMASEDPGVMMPELGRTVADPLGVALIRNYIAEMGPGGR